LRLVHRNRASGDSPTGGRHLYIGAKPPRLS
jgi:hypothetical protein